RPLTTTMRPRWRARRRERVISSGRSHRWWRINARRCSWSCSKASPTARSPKCRACRLEPGCRDSRAPACRSRPISTANAPRFAVSNKSRKKTMIDRDSPVTENELHAYVDDEIAADRRGAVEAWLASHPEDAARVAQWRARAGPAPPVRGPGRCDPRALRHPPPRTSPRTLRPRQARPRRTFLARNCRRGGDRGVSRWRRRRLDGAWGIGGGAEPLRYVHRPGARCPQGLRGRGAPFGRGSRAAGARLGANDFQKAWNRTVASQRVTP